MADDADLAFDFEQARLRSLLSPTRAPIPAGEPGICDECGEDMPRLIDSRCGYCRDGRRPPLSRFDDTPARAPAVSLPILVQREETIMTVPNNENSRVISVPAKGAVLAAIESFAADEDLPLGQAVIKLVELGITDTNVIAADKALAAFSVDDLLDDLSRRYALAANITSDEQRAAVERAEAAEARLAAVQAALGSAAA